MLKFGPYVIFATADEEDIPVDTSFGKKKKDGTVIHTGQFVSCMISQASAPSQTKLTILAKRNGCSFLKIADDLRQVVKNTPLVGIAVMSSSDSWGNIGDKCQLVILDTMVHINQ